jgi:hypothetical protein
MKQYDFTPNKFALLLIFLLSYLLWRVEINLLYYYLGANWYSTLILLVSFLTTPFLIWWLIGVFIYLLKI